MKATVRMIARSFRELLFPPLCLHCRSTIREPDLYLCDSCTGKLELIDPIERCPRCFSAEYSVEHRQCETCRSHGMPLQQMAAACDYTGPPASIMRKLKYGNQPYLAKGAGAYGCPVLSARMAASRHHCARSHFIHTLA